MSKKKNGGSPKVPAEQATLFDLMNVDTGSPATDREPATALMKKVAEKAPKMRNIERSFSYNERDEIIRNIKAQEELNSEERIALREAYRKMKRRVLEMEKGNQSRVIVFPSMTNGSGWYKMINFSAMYYTYRLADRMGRKVSMRKDTDKVAKGYYAASIQGIERFVEQFKQLEDPEVEITEDGVYIFTLKKPLTDDEVGALRRTEEMRKDRMHNILRPKAMDPATFNAILMSVRQIVPRMRKLERYYFYAIGEGMMSDLTEMMAIYYEFSDGVYERKEAGAKLLRLSNRLMSGLTILSEVEAWSYDAAVMIGENLNEVKKIIIKEFNIRGVEE